MTNWADASTLSLGQLTRLARQCAPNVAVSTLAAIAQTESSLDPVAVHDNTARIAEAPQGRAEATDLASRLIAAGHSVDLGLMQVNSTNLALLGITIEDAFDPCRSIAAGAAILTAGYAGGASHGERQAALRVAISRYNTGNAERGFSNGYVRRVELANARVVPALDVDAELPAAVAPPDHAGGQAPPRSGLPPWEVFPPNGGSARPASAPAWEVFPADEPPPRSASGPAWQVFPPEPTPLPAARIASTSVPPDARSGG